MRKLIVFNHITLDGYFVGVNGDSSWAHANNDDAEFSAFVQENAKGEAQLLFGRVTYELMASYWPTPQAAKDNPIVAKGMNSMEKVVFSKKLDKVSWSNTKLVKGDLVTEVRKLKNESGPGLLIMGSGSLISQLAQARLIDEYQIIVNPVFLGKGRTLFETVEEKQSLKLTKTKVFKNGKVFMRFEAEA